MSDAASIWVVSCYREKKKSSNCLKPKQCSERMLKASVKISKGLSVSNLAGEGFVRGKGWGADIKGGRCYSPGSVL